MATILNVDAPAWRLAHCGPSVLFFECRRGRGAEHEQGTQHALPIFELPTCRSLPPLDCGLGARCRSASKIGSDAILMVVIPIEIRLRAPEAGRSFLGRRSRRVGRSPCNVDADNGYVSRRTLMCGGHWTAPACGGPPAYAAGGGQPVHPHWRSSAFCFVSSHNRRKVIAFVGEERQFESCHGRGAPFAVRRFPIHDQREMAAGTFAGDETGSLRLSGIGANGWRPCSASIRIVR